MNLPHVPRARMLGCTPVVTRRQMLHLGRRTPEEQEEAVSLMEQAGLKVKFKTTRNWGETCFIFAK